MGAILKGLKTVELPVGSNPVLNRRMRLIRRLEEQAKLAADPSYIRVTTSFEGKGAERHQVQREQGVSSWAKEQIDGSMIFTVKIGMSPVELSPGKPGILVESKDALPDLIQNLVAAVREGEFDAFLAKTKKPGNPTKANSNAASAASAKVQGAASAGATATQKSKSKQPVTA
jgi:hypothetical protein